MHRVLEFRPLLLIAAWLLMAAIQPLAQSPSQNSSLTFPGEKHLHNVRQLTFGFINIHGLTWHILSFSLGV